MFMVTCDNYVRYLQFHSSIQKLYIPVCPKKALGTNLLNFEKYVFNCSFIYDRFVLFCFSTVNNERRVFQRVCVCFYYSIYFFGDYESSFISWTSISSWFLKFSLTQTNRKCKVFHFTSLCKILIEWFFLFSHFWHWLIVNFNGVRKEVGI